MPTFASTHHPADLSFRKRFRLFFAVPTVVVLLGGVKTAVHYFGLEFLQLNAQLTSDIGGTIFIIGFLLSGILADKEAERIPAEIRTAMEAINGNLFVKMGTAWWLLSR